MTTVATAPRATPSPPALQLGFGLVFDDLYRYEGLLRLDQMFLQHLGKCRFRLAEVLQEHLVQADQALTPVKVVEDE